MAVAAVATSAAATLEANIAKGRRVRTVSAQREVAFALCAASATQTIHEGVVKKGGIKTLVTLIQSQDEEVQRFAILALANTSVTALYRLQIANEASALEHVVSYLSHEASDKIGKQYCAMVVGNLAANAENHEAIARFGGIPALVSLLAAAAKDQGMEGGRYAAFALANLAASANHRKEIVDCGAMEPLIVFACVDDNAVQHQAVAALRGICICPEYRIKAVRRGILDPLILMARRSDDLSLRRAVASALNCLSTMDENKDEVADRALSTIISLLMSTDDEVEGHACCAIANLVEVVDIHSRFFREKGLPPVVTMSKSKTTAAAAAATTNVAIKTNAKCKADACRALANLAANAAVQQDLAREGVIESMVDVLREDTNVDCQKYAVLCIANLATTLAGQIEIVEANAIGPLASLLNQPSTSLAIADIRRYSALAMANLSATQANHDTMVSTDGALTALYTLSTSSDVMSLYYVGCCLANLCSDSTNHSKVVAFGGIQPLLILASNKDSDVYSHAAAALRGLSTTADGDACNVDDKADDNFAVMSIRRNIVQEGGLEPISRLLLSKDIHVLRDVTACLCNLSLSDENKREIANCGAVPPLLAHMQNEDMLIASQSSTCLANIAEESINQTIIAQNGGILPCIAVMRTKHLEVQRECGRLLSNLCACTVPDHIQTVMDGGGHESLISFLLSDDLVCQRVGAFGLGNLCSHEDKQRVSLLRVGIFEPLASLARSEDTEVELRRFATLAIANLASTVDNHADLIADGILPMLVSLSTSSDADVRNFAAFAVSKIAVNPDMRQAVTNEGGLEPILYLARTDDHQVQRSLLPAISSMSFVDSNKVDICNSGGLPALIADVLSYGPDEGSGGDHDRSGCGVDGGGVTCSSSNNSSSRLACCGIANLAERVENQPLIVKSNAIPLLVDALLAPQANVQREAARALGNLAASGDNAVVMVEAGALSRLAVCLQRRETECKRMAVFALGNIASNGKLHGDILTEPSILDVLAREVRAVLDPKCQSDIETTRFSLLVLANLSSQSDNHSVLCARCLDDIIAYSKCGDLKCRSYAILALGNFSSVTDQKGEGGTGNTGNTSSLAVITSTEGIKSLISFAFSASGELESTTNAQFHQAIAGLRGLATNDASRKEIVRQGGLEPLILAATRTTGDGIGGNGHNKECLIDVDVQSEAAAAMRNLSLSSDAKLVMCQRGLISALLSLVRSGDPLTQVHAIAALGNLADTGGAVLKHLLDEDCVGALLDLATKVQERLLVVEGRGAVAPGVEVDEEVNTQIARCLSIFACHVQSHQALVSGDCLCLEQLVRLSSASLPAAAANRGEEVKNDDNPVLSAATLACSRFASLAMAALAYNSSNHPRLVQAGAFDALLSLSLSKDVGTCRCVADALHRVALNEEENLITMASSAFSQAIVSLLAFNDADTNLRACLVTKSACTSLERRRQFNEAGGVGPLLACGKRFFMMAEIEGVDTTGAAAGEDQVDVERNDSAENGIGICSPFVPQEGSREMCAALRNLSTSCAEAQIEIGQRGVGGVQFLVEQCRSSDDDTVLQACATLANLSEAPVNREPMLRQYGVLQYLKSALQDPDCAGSSDERRREAIRAIANLSSGLDLAPDVATAGVLVPLVDQLTSNDPRCRHYGALAISNLSSHETNLERIVREGAVGPLLALVEKGLLMRNKSSCTAGETEEGASMTSSDNDTVATYTGRFALLALANLAASHRNHSALLESEEDVRGVVLLSLLEELTTRKDIDTIVSSSTVLCIANLASNPTNFSASTTNAVVGTFRRCLGPLLQLLSTHVSKPGRSTASFGWCIKALRGMTSSVTLRKDVLGRAKEGALSTAFIIVRAMLARDDIDEKELEADTIGALCNLSMGGHLGDAIRNDLLDSDCISSNLIKLLRSDRSTYRLFGAIAMGNAAADTILKDRLLDAGAIDALIHTGTSGVDTRTKLGRETKRSIAYSLCNLLAGASHRSAVVESGGLDLIVSLGQVQTSPNSCGREEEHRSGDLTASLTTTRNLTTSSPEYRERIASAGALDVIALGIKRQLDFSRRQESPSSGDTCSHLPFPYLQDACSIMHSLSLNERTKLSLLKHSCVMKNATALLLFTPRGGLDASAPSATEEWSSVLCQVTRMVANCCENQSLVHDVARLVKVEALLGLLTLDEASLSREVARLFANMTCCVATHKDFLSSTIPEKILGLCRSSDGHTAQSALVSVLNLALVPKNRRRLLEAGISKGGPISVVKDCCLASRCNSEGEEEHVNLLTQKLRYACLALSAFAIDPSHHERLLNDGIIIPIVNVLGQSNGDDDGNANINTTASRCAGFTISMLAQNPDNAAALSMSGVASILVEIILHSTDTGTVGQALVALRSLAFSLDFQQEIIQMQPNANVFVALSRAFAHAQKTRAMMWMAREISACFCELSRHDENKSALAHNAKSMAIVLDLARSTDSETARFGLAALANVTEDISAQEQIVSSDDKASVLPFLLHQMNKTGGRPRHIGAAGSGSNSSVDVDIRREAIRATSNLLSATVCHKSFLDLGGLKALEAAVLRFSQSGGTSSCREILYAAALAYRKLAANPEMHKHLIPNESLQIMFRLLDGPAAAKCTGAHICTRQQAALALQELASNEFFKTQFVGNGGLKAVSQLLLNCCRSVARALGCETAIDYGEDDGDRPDDDPLPLMTTAVNILRHLSISARLKDLMIEQEIPLCLSSCIEGITCTTSTRSDDNGSIDLPFLSLCAATIANMIEHEEGRGGKGVAGEGLFRLLTSMPLHAPVGAADKGDKTSVATIQKNVARALCSLSYEECNHVEMLGDSKCVQVLLELLSANGEAVRYAASALGNLSLSYSGQQKIGALGGIDRLSFAFDSCQKAASRCLCRLSSAIEIAPGTGIAEEADEEQKNGVRIIQAGDLLSKLLGLLSAARNPISDGNNDEAANEVEKTQYLAAMVLCNVAYDSSNHEGLLKAACLKPLVALLGSRNAMCRRYSILALCHLSLSSRYHGIILDQIEGEESTLTSLINLLDVRVHGDQQGDNRSAEFAANFINNLAVVAARRPHLESLLFSDEKMMTKLVELTSSGILSVKRSSARALYSLSRLWFAGGTTGSQGSQPFVLTFASEATTSALFALCSNQDDECRRLAVMAICNLSANPEVRSGITKNGGLQAAIRLLSDSDDECRSLACLCLANLCNTSNTQEQAVVHGALGILQRLITVDANDKTYNRSRSPAIASLINICANKANHDTILHGDIGLLSSQSRSSSQHQRYSSASANKMSIQDHLCAYAVANLICSGSSDNLPAIVDSGGIDPILELLKNSGNDTCGTPPPADSSSHGKCLCLAAVKRLAAFSPEYRGNVIEGGILTILSSYGRRQPPMACRVEVDCLREVAACLFELTSSPNLRKDVEAYCRDVLFLTARSTDIETATKGLGTVGNIAEEIDLHRNLRDFGIVKMLSSRLSSAQGVAIIGTSSGGEGDSTGILCETTRALSNLLSTSSCQLDFVRCGGLDDLMNLVSSKLTNSAAGSLKAIARNIAISLRKLSFKLSSHCGLVDGLASLYVLMEAEDTATATDAALVLKNLSANEEHKSALAKNDATKRLIDLSRRTEVETKRLAMASLCHLATPVISTTTATSRNERILKDHLIDRNCPLVPAIQCITTPDQELHRIVASLFSQLSEYCRRGYPSTAKKLVANGIVPALISLSRGRKGGEEDEETQRHCSQSLVNLCSVTEDEKDDVRFTIYRQGGLDCLLDLMKSHGARKGLSGGNHGHNVAVGLRLLMSNRKVCRAVSRSPKKILSQLVLLTKHSSLDYQRSATSALGSLTQTNPEPRSMLVEAIHKGSNDIITATKGRSATLIDDIIHLLHRSPDVIVKRNAAVVLANCAEESVDLRQELVHRGVLETLSGQMNVGGGGNGDGYVRAIRDITRVLSCLSTVGEGRNIMVQDPQRGDSIMKRLLSLSRSADAPTQRNATLALCNICLGGQNLDDIEDTSEGKDKILSTGTSNALAFLCKFPDREVQRLGALSMAGLSLRCRTSKRLLLQEGCHKVLLRMLRFPDSEILEGSSLALNSLLLHLGLHASPALTNQGEETLLDKEEGSEILNVWTNLIGMSNEHIVFSGLYGLGTLLPALDGGLIERIIRKTEVGAIETKRAGGYLLAHVASDCSRHDALQSARGIECIVSMASLSDPECCECGAFCLSILSKNENLQSPLVKEYHAVSPLVAIINGGDQQGGGDGRSFAASALLNLAEDHSNHLLLGDQGAISALLTISREGDMNAIKASAGVFRVASAHLQHVESRSRPSNLSIQNGSNFKE